MESVKLSSRSTQSTPAAQQDNGTGNHHAPETTNKTAEHATDAVAATANSTGSLLVQRACSHCEDERIDRKQMPSFIQRKDDGSGKASDDVTSGIKETQHKGSPMSEATKNFMEDRFGTDFSSVKVHTGDKAEQLSGQLGAQAFTVGNDIYFNNGKYAPDSSDGKHLLAHELTHTIQQGGGQQGPKVQRKIQVNSGVELDTKGFTVTKSGNTYTCPHVVKNSVWNEMFTSLLVSPRIFKLAGKTSEEANESLHQHMTGRMGIIQFASKKKYDFAAGAASKVNSKYWDGPLKLKDGANPVEALNDLNIHPKEYAIACLAATTMTMVGGAQSNYIEAATSDSKDWVPGDWGYIRNTKFSGKADDVGLEGENIIYVGKDSYWGHFTGTNTYRSFEQWFNEVTGSNGGAETRGSRRFPLRGL
jgi:hypothetical protein